MKTPQILILLVLADVAIFAPARATAATLIGISSVDVGSMGEYNPSYARQWMIDGSGLTGNVHTTNSDNFHWASNSGEITGSVTFALDTLVQVEFARVWNYNQSGYGSWGVKDFEVSFSTDGINFNPNPGSPFTLQQAGTAFSGGTYGSDYETVDFANTNATHVRFKILSNYGAAGSGLSEVQFFGSAIPEPSRALLSVLGLGMALLRRSRPANWLGAATAEKGLFGEKCGI